MRNGLWMVLVLCALHSTSAFADIIVLAEVNQGQYPEFSVEYVDGEWNVVLSSTGEDNLGGVFRIRSTSNATDIIRYVVCDLDDLTGVGLYVEANPNANGALVKTVKSITSIGEADIVMYLCETSHDVGSIAVHAIGTVVADGNLTGSITSGSNVTKLEIGGAVTGNVSAANGLIKNIEAGGAIGSGGTPISITAHDYVRRVMGASVHAAISATGTGVPYGALARIVSTSGDFTGSLTCERIVPIDQGQYNIDWNIAGDLVADVTCEWYLHSDFTIYVNGSLEGDITFDLDDGLQGQIILNAGNDGGEWNGTITVDDMTLSGPNYTQTSAQIGGGAVGLAPFNFHATNCVPADNATVTAEPGTVTLSHYGPVEKYGQTTVAELKIVRHPLVHFCAECDETVTGQFSWQYAANGRDIVITPGQGYAFEDGYEYHITPVITGETVLRCQGVAGNPVVQSYDYNFKVDVP